ncbi:MAG TPA: membrane protein insertase YidC [Syntrophaceae bacterium]|nr:membrane protein insertase YidC [Syntrophaceae bacterium]
MQFRALLAFILAILVLIVYQRIATPPHQKAPSPKEESPQVIKEEGREVPRVVSDMPEKIRGTGRDIFVSTDLYTAIFTENGARLKSFKLKKYRETMGDNSPPKELVTTSDLEELPLETDFYQGSIKDFKTAIFKAHKDSIVLDGIKKAHLNFEWATPEGIKVVKTYSFHSHSYKIDLDVRVENLSNRVLQDRLKVTLKTNPYAATARRFTFTGPAALINGSLTEIKTKKINREKDFPGKISWVGYEDVYFLSAIIPDKPQDSLVKIEVKQNNLIYTSLISPPIVIYPEHSETFHFHLYLGPKDLDVLKELGYGLDKAVNFGFFQIVAKPLLSVLKLLFKFCHNYGIAIILLTVLVKIIFWPLTHKSYQSMKAMQKLQPQMAKLREKYKNDRERMNKELMALYRTYKINPMSGCLPMLLQIPVFFALYKILLYAIEIRHAPFFLWINDLSAPDRLAIGFQIPYTGGLPVLTLLMGASMFIQQKMTPSPGDPTQQKFMMFLPIIFTFMFLNFPSGLVLYWLVNNLLSIGQQYCINKGISLSGVFLKMRRNSRIS